jgi:hypothetical protein
MAVLGVGAVLALAGCGDDDPAGGDGTEMTEDDMTDMSEDMSDDMTDEG